ncbi:hypothetical protein ACVW0W_003226 [Bradyrhizobium sp. USDA 4469]
MIKFIRLWMRRLNEGVRPPGGPTASGESSQSGVLVTMLEAALF